MASVMIFGLILMNVVSVILNTIAKWSKKKMAPSSTMSRCEVGAFGVSGLLNYRTIEL